MAQRGRRLALLEVRDGIVQAIAEGAFDWVAAEAAGVTPRTFALWMQRGREAEAGEYTGAHAQDYLHFFLDVRSARARARVDAEHRVYSERPLEWLRYGPGRERGEEPGWTQARRDVPNPAQSVADAILLEALRTMGLDGEGSAGGAAGDGAAGALSSGAVEVDHG